MESRGFKTVQKAQVHPDEIQFLQFILYQREPFVS